MAWRWLLDTGTGEGIVDERYDVITLPGVRRPMALGFKTDEIRRVIRETLINSIFVIPAKAGIQLNQATGHRFSPV